MVDINHDLLLLLSHEESQGSKMVNCTKNDFSIYFCFRPLCFDRVVIGQFLWLVGPLLLERKVCALEVTT